MADLVIDEKWNALKADFPKIFSHFKRNFECDIGWEPIIREACEKIEPILKGSEKNELYAVQVKEKFGGLRFYFSSIFVVDIQTPQGNELWQINEDVPSYTKEEMDIMDAAIMEAETKSFHICEICGEPGELRPGNWIRTLCNNHAPKGEIK